MSKIYTIEFYDDFQFDIHEIEKSASEIYLDNYFDKKDEALLEVLSQLRNTSRLINKQLSKARKMLKET